MKEHFNQFNHQSPDDQQEFIAGFNQPSAAEQERGESMMTNEQKQLSEDRKREFERQRQEEIPLIAPYRTYYRPYNMEGPDHGGNKNEFGNEGYSHNETLWISEDGKIYLRQRLVGKHISKAAKDPPDTVRNNSAEISREGALKLIDAAMVDAENNVIRIKALQLELKADELLQDQLRIARKRIEALPLS